MKFENWDFFENLSSLLSKKIKDQGIQSYNLACCLVWVWNLVADIEGGT